VASDTYGEAELGLDSIESLTFSFIVHQLLCSIWMYVIEFS